MFIDARQAALNFRNDLFAQNWPDAAGVAKLVGLPLTPEKAGAYASDLRARGHLLGVWAAPHQAFVYPTFQFDSCGHVRPEIVGLLLNLPKNDPGGWRRAFWLYSPHAHLDSQTPAQLFTVYPLLVIRVAQHEFSESADDDW